MQKLKLEWHQTVKKGSDVVGLGWVLLKTVEIIRFCCLCSLHHIYKSFHCSKLEKIVTRNHFQDNFSLVLCDLKLFTVGGGGVPGQAMPHHNILNITRWSWHRGEAAHLSPSLVTLVTTSPSPCVCHSIVSYLSNFTFNEDIHYNDNLSILLLFYYQWMVQWFLIKLEITIQLLLPTWQVQM